MSNFLFARGIAHERGRKYPSDYAVHSGRSFGYYDLHLSTGKGWIDVEIWGDKPHGHAEAEYARKRAAKEAYHAECSSFLGINFRSCYNEAELALILAPFIGVVAAHVFNKPTDHLVESTHWSNADELLAECRRIAHMQPDGMFPNEQWLRKRGRYSDRPGPVYNTLAIYIRLWLGGIRNLRKLLGQNAASTEKWTREKALMEFAQWHHRYGRSPSAIRSLAQRGRCILNEAEYQRAARIAAAINLHVGGTIAACDALGIRPSRRYGIRSQNRIETADNARGQ